MMEQYAKIDQLRQLLKQYTDSNQDHDFNPSIREVVNELSTTLEELEVMHEELEAQNEEIELSRQEAVNQGKRYQDLFEFAPDAYVITDRYLKILEATQATCELLKVRPDFIIGRLLITFVCMKDRRTFRSIAGSLEHPTHFETCLQLNDGHVLTVAVRVSPVVNSEHRRTGFRWILRDITREKQVQDALNQSENRFRNIFHTASIGTALINQRGMFVEVNHSLTRFLGLDPVTDQSAAIHAYVFREDQTEFDEMYRMVSHQERHSAQREIRFRHDSGNIVWGSVTLSLIQFPLEEDQFLLLMVEDITEQKKMLAEREEMQRRIIDSIEAERLHLARELHDNPLQNLYVILFELEGISDAITDTETIERISQLKTLLMEVASGLRATCGELRPPTIGRYGLDVVVNSYIEAITNINPQVDINLKMDIDHQELPERLVVTIYRVIQESLHNVIRHSEADQVRILIANHDQRLNLRIEDNGKGFQAPENLLDLMREEHYGLAGMYERAKAVDGDLRIQSADGGGTVIELSVPVNYP
jgi:PAS domain S-box-containing protein